MMVTRRIRTSGFTLIELVVVIVILGILSVVAAPRFLNLQNDARASVVEGLAGAIRDTSQLGYSIAAIEGVETECYQYIGSGCPSGSGSVEHDGQNYGFHFGYPIISDRGGESPNYDNGLFNLMDVSAGYSSDANWSTKEWVWASNGAQGGSDEMYITLSELVSDSSNPSNGTIFSTDCYVRYTLPSSEGESVEVVTETSGC